MTMFASLQRVRDTLASCKAVNLEPATFAALEEALQELDAAMVQDVRERTYMKTLPPASPAYTLGLLRLYENASNPRGPRPLTALGPDDDTRDPDEMWDEHLQWKHKTQDKYND